MRLTDGTASQTRTSSNLTDPNLPGLSKFEEHSAQEGLDVLDSNSVANE